MPKPYRAGISRHLVVTGNQGVANASVDVKNQSTGFQATTITNEKGDYLFKELPLGGPHVVHITSVGFTGQTQPGFMLNQGDLVKVDFTPIDTSIQLQGVTVVSIWKAGFGR